MPASQSRINANRRNAQKSTGPKTEEGKARSRSNSLKHGRTGQGVVLMPEDADEVATLSGELQAELRPSGPMGRILVRRIAVLSVRLDRCVEHEASTIAEKVRHAPEDHQDRRFAEVLGLLDALADDPPANLRKLRRTPEGVDALVDSWLLLRSDLAHSHPKRWTSAHAGRANDLAGRGIEDVHVSEIDELAETIWGNPSLAEDPVDAGLDAPARKARARDRLSALIDREVEGLRDHRESLDLDAFERDRAEAGKRALFDGSAEAALARKYEATAERGLFRAIRELRQVESEAAERPEPGDRESLGSFFPPDEVTATSRPERESSPPPDPIERPAPVAASPRVATSTPIPTRTMTKGCAATSDPMSSNDPATAFDKLDLDQTTP